MKQEVLNEPLAGEEIKYIIARKVEEAMAKNQPLVDDVTYAGFRVKFEIKIEFVRSVVPGTLVWGDIAEGVQDGAVDVLAASGEYVSDPSPNRTREDSDMPLPVMVMTPTGPQKRRVRIQNAGKGKK